LPNPTAEAEETFAIFVVVTAPKPTFVKRYSPEPVGTQTSPAIPKTALGLLFHDKPPANVPAAAKLNPLLLLT
jgi:hypothetical protein